MRAGRSAPYSDVYVACVTFGSPGKLTRRPSSRLTNSDHSCADADVTNERMSAAKAAEIRCMTALRISEHHDLRPERSNAPSVGKRIHPWMDSTGAPGEA